MDDLAQLVLAVAVVVAPLGLAWWWLGVDRSFKRPPPHRRGRKP
jgi:hypothetical protein